MSAIEKLQTAKVKADSTQADRQNYASYVDAMRESGWTDEDVAEYREEVERIMKSGTEDEKRAASDFWRSETDYLRIANGINNRIRASLAEEKRKVT